MTISKLKEILSKISNDELEIFIRNSNNPMGNISDFEQLEIGEYGFFGENIPCIILNSEVSKDIEIIDDNYVNFIEEVSKK